MSEPAGQLAEWPRDGLERVAACPVCGDEQRALLYEGLTDRIWFAAPGRWRLHRCLGCSSAYLDPRPDRQTIALAYSSYFTHDDDAPAARAEVDGIRVAIRNGYVNRRYGYRLAPASRLGPLVARLLPKRRWYADRRVRHLPRPCAGGRLLDVGCGDGAFLAEMARAGWAVQGVEPDPAAAARAGRDGVPVVTARLEEADLPAASFDAVTMNHVVEHFHDPVAALRICFGLLRPGGRVWLATPNLASRGHAEFAGDWIGLDPPRHLVLFDRASLVRALESAGFANVRFERDYSSERTFPCSATVGAGADPRRPEVVARHRSRAAIALADVRAALAPETAEDLVALARRLD